MSRFNSPLGLGTMGMGRFGLGNFGFGGPDQEAEPIPKLAEKQAEGALAALTNKTLGGLQYLGETLDKPGRAVRGTLSGLMGGPWGGGLLNLLPMSDTAGITSPQEGVSGRGLLEQAGLLSPNVEGFHPIANPADAVGDVAGFGAEILLDPLTYLTGPGKALTGAGKAAERTGRLARTTAGRIAAGQGGLLGLGLPFRDPSLVLGTGPRALAVAQRVGNAVDAARYGRYSPIPAARALFDRSVKDKINPLWHRASDALAGRESELQRGVSKAIYDVHAYAAQHNLTDDQINLARYVVEGLDPVADLGISDPRTATAVQGLAEMLKDYQTRIYRLRGQAGHTLTPRDNYFTRYITPLDEPGFTSSDIARDPVFNLFDRLGGTRKINELWTDPEVAGFARPWNDQQAADLIRQRYLGNPTQAALQDLQDRHARHLTERLNIPERQWRAIDQNYRDQIENMAARLNAGETLAKMVKESPHANRGIPLFGNSPLDDFSTYMKAQANKILEHETAQRLIGQNAVMGPAAEGTKTATDALAAAKLGGTRARAYLTNLLAQRLGMRPRDVYRALEQGQVQVPREIYDLLSAPRSNWTMPEPLQRAVSLYDKLGNMTKGALTSALPAGVPFNIRNRVAGELNNVLEGAARLNAGRMANALARGESVVPGAQELIQRVTGQALSPEAATARLAELAYVNNVAGRTSLSQSLGNMVGSPGSSIGKVLPGQPGWIEGWTGLKDWLTSDWSGSWNPFNVRGGMTGAPIDEVSPNVLFRKGEQLSGATEGINRLEPFIAKLMQGYAPSVAGEVSNKAHFDYSDMARFEKEVMKRLFPFYSFARKNMAYQADKLLNDPGPTAALVRGLTEPRSDEYSPTWIREKGNINLGPTPSGATRYITGFGLPIEEATGRFVIGPGGLGRTADQFLSMLNSVPRTALESLTGKQFFSGRPLTDLDPLLGRITSNVNELLGGKALNREQLRMYPDLLEQLVSASPASRVLSMVRTATDARKRQSLPDLAALAATLGTGVRIQDVSPEEMRRAQTQDAKTMATQLLENDPAFGRFERFYLDKDKRKTATVDQKQLMALYNLLKERDRQRAAELRKKEGKR